MPSTRPPVSERRPRPVREPLRLRSFARSLEGRPGSDVLIEAASSLDRRIEAAARQASAGGVSPEARDRWLAEMVELRRTLDRLVASSGADVPHSLDETPALRAVEPAMRLRLAELCGVELLPEFYPLLELKAAEWVEQGRAFDEVADELGYAEGRTLGVGEERGALILTHNASLMQLSAPKHDKLSVRKFVYQSIYDNRIPAEGTLVLTEPVVLDRAVRAVRLTTSAVRKLRLAAPRADWRHQRDGFARATAALATAGPANLSKTCWGVSRRWIPPAATPAQRPDAVRTERRHLDKLYEGARDELRRLAAELGDASRAPRPSLGMEILGHCMYMQRLRIEAGERAHAIDKVVSFETDRGERVRVRTDGGRQTAGLRLERAAWAPVELGAGAIGDQLVVRGAPVALLDPHGALAGVLGEVARVETH